MALPRTIEGMLTTGAKTDPPPSIPGSSASPRRLSVLFFGPVPPPYHGVTVINESLLSSRFVEVFDVVKIKTNFTAHVSDLGKFRVSKLLLLLRYVFEAHRALWGRSYDFVLFPINFTAKALLRDLFLLSCIAFLRPRIVFYAHGNYLPQFRASSSLLMQKVIDFTMRLAVASIVPGDKLKYNFELYLPPDRIAVVPHGVEPFRSGAVRKRNLSQLQILFLSHLSFAKGVDTVVKAIPKVVAKRQDIKFVFAGEWLDGAEAQWTKEFVRRHGLEDFIEWRGLVTGTEKEQLYYSSDIFVFPTCHESFGLVNLEAMQAGLPIITTAHGEIPRLIEHEINGFTIPEQDPDALAEYILRLCNDDKLRRQMKQNNERKFWREYTKEQYVERMIAAFHRLHELLERR